MERKLYFALVQNSTVRSKRVNERCERTSERRSEWPSTLRVDFYIFSSHSGLPSRLIYIFLLHSVLPFCLSPGTASYNYKRVENNCRFLDEIQCAD